MDNAVLEYRKRRQARLDAAAIERYRIRRDARLRGRMDADGDEEGNNRPSGGGGHGNTKIPFGLCQREGIQIDPKWSPKDAWEALAGKGYSAGEVYAQLRATGKAGKSGAAKRKTASVKPNMLDVAFERGAGKKKLDAFNSVLSSVDMEEHVADFISNAGALMSAGGFEGSLSTRTGRPGGEHLTVTRRKATGEAISALLSIPDLSKSGDEYRESESCSFAHELTHYLNLCGRNRKSISNKLYTDTDKDLTKATEDAYRNKENIGKKIQDELDKNSSEWRKQSGELWKEANKELSDITRKYKDGGFGSYKEYSKAWNKARRDWEDEIERKRCAFNDGASVLSNIYDALTFGEYGSSGRSHYAHGKGYFGRDVNCVKDELLSMYVELHMLKNRKWINLFREDQPELSAALDNTIRGLLKNAGVR